MTVEGKTMQAKAKTEQKAETIEYEEIKLKIPKRIMDWLRAKEKITGESVTHQLEFNAVDVVRANLEELSGNEMAEWLKLGPVFRETLKDE